MDDRELEDRYADITLEDEEVSFEVQNADVDGVTEAPPNLQWALNVMATVWTPVRGVRITEVRPNLFVYQFFHAKDMQRVIDGGPWAFENHTLVCKQIKQGDQPNLVQLNEVLIWVQVYDLPFGYDFEKVLEQIGNFMGRFIAVDSNNFGGSWNSSYIRIRVALKVEVPLRRKMKLKLREGTSVWIMFKYERLHTFCFFCGMLGHTDKLCSKAMDSNIAPEQYPYGAWLRAPMRRGNTIVRSPWLVTGNESIVGLENMVGKEVVTTDDVHEEDNEVVVDLKRRRSGVEHDGLGETSLTPMALDGPKNLYVAGSGSQTRPSQ
ncbi:uncharacterized protein LOC116016045 [Ipomoea triloba]|uniref:uncharacterized protein LOC116016045 n=1 Tax=Ipomoea triloba TaxID=35885 RepID=UPI00125E6FC0|nr:uncharacterized protein LOC116016045 [Ipomoea triloba]